VLIHKTPGWHIRSSNPRDLASATSVPELLTSVSPLAFVPVKPYDAKAARLRWFSFALANYGVVIDAEILLEFAGKTLEAYDRAAE
jgi:hypothetical protein